MFEKNVWYAWIRDCGNSSKIKREKDDLFYYHHLKALFGLIEQNGAEWNETEWNEAESNRDFIPLFGYVVECVCSIVSKVDVKEQIITF